MRQGLVFAICDCVGSRASHQISLRNIHGSVITAGTKPSVKCYNRPMANTPKTASLYPLKLDEAISVLLRAKPEPQPRARKKRRKRSA